MDAHTIEQGVIDGRWSNATADELMAWRNRELEMERELAECRRENEELRAKLESISEAPA